MLKNFLRWGLSKPRLSAFALLLILSAIAWTLLFEVMSARIARSNEELRKNGRPICADDLNQEPIPDSVNPALLYVQAGSIANAYTTTQPYFSDLVYPFNDAWVKAAQEAESALAPAFTLVSQASKLPNGRNNTRFKSPLLNLMLPNLSPSKEIARALSDSACLHNIQGDSFAALGRINDILDVERSTTNEPTLVSGLVSIGEWSLAAETAMSIAPTLKSEDLPKTRDAIVLLIGRFLDERSRNQGIVSGISGDRVMVVDMAQVAFKSIWIGKPLGYAGELYVVRRYNEIEEILNSPDKRARINRLERPQSFSDPRSVMDTIMPALGAVVERHFRGLGQTRSAAAALAIHLYRMEHDGRLPASLDELVPRYLPAVPKDPYTQKPLGYWTLKGSIPGGGDRPVLCFDLDSIDKGPDPEKPVYDWARRGRSEDIRQYRDLSGFKQVLPPAPEPEDDHSQQADDAGDEQQPEKGAPEESPDQPGNGSEK